MKVKIMKVKRKLIILLQTIIEYSIDFTRPLRYTFYIVAAVFVLHFASPTKRQVKQWETFLII